MSTIKTETLSTPSNATVPVDTVVNGTAKAWVNFDGSGTVAIRRAFNVSSITDNGTGSYAVNFTNSMLDANASAVTGTGFNVAGGFNALGTLISASKADIYTYSIAGGGAGSYQDTAQVSVTIFS